MQSMSMKGNPEHLFRTTSELFWTIGNRVLDSEGHLVNDQNAKVKPTGNWACSREKMVYLSKDANAFSAVKETENHKPVEPSEDSKMSLKA